MDLNSEFKNIRNSFCKVKEEISFITDKVYENYDEFMGHHLKLVKEVKKLSQKSSENSKAIKNLPTKLSEKDLLNIKSDIKETKEFISSIQKKHKVLEDSIKEIANNKKNIKDLKNKYQNSELEIFLLKERLIEKDVELKQIKDINKHMFNTMQEFAKIEMELFTKTPQKIK